MLPRWIYAPAALGAAFILLPLVAIVARVDWTNFLDLIDASAPLEITGKRAAALIPGGQLKIYEGAPHGLFVTHAARLNADIESFVRR